MTDTLAPQRRLAAQIRQAISSGTICGKCHQIPDDCTCPGATNPALDPLRAHNWWDQRAELAGIRDYARASGANPAAVLAVTIMRVLAQTPYTVTTPAITGGPGSLNLFAAIVGESGQGKGAATAASRYGVEFQHGDLFDEVPPGSGEGLVKSFAFMETDNDTKESALKWSARSVLFDVAEISGLAGQMGRSGSTLGDQLLKAFSGEKLGFTYAGQNGVQLPSHEYRFTMVAGVQPAASGALLGEEVSSRGLPQRFIWASATDPDMPDFTLEAMHRRPIRLRLPDWSIGTETVGVDEEIILAIGQNQRRNVRGDDGTLNGHRMFAQLKVAAALAFMRGAKHVTAEDWALSEDVMVHSDIARQVCVDALKRAAGDRARQRGEERALTAASEDAATTERIRRRLLEKFRKDPTATASTLVQSFAGRDKPRAWEVLEVLAEDYPDLPRRKVA